jgi:transposase
MAVRGLGCPVRFTLTAGQKGDAPRATALIAGLTAEVVMADTAYDADHLRQAIAAKGALAIIPNNPSRALKYPLDKHLYAQRHLVECCFSKLKQFRRVATRFGGQCPARHNWLCSAKKGLRPPAKSHSIGLDKKLRFFGGLHAPIRQIHNLYVHI